MPTDFSKAPDRTRTHSLKWTQYPNGVLPVWVADTDFQAPEPILEALRSKLQHGVLGYEFPQKALCETVAARMAALYGWSVDPEAVVATPGIIAAFNAAAWAVCQPGQGILTQPPVYPPFLGVAENVGLVNQFAQLGLEERNGTLSYHIDMDAFRAALHNQNTRTGMFLLCNPHNPTGQVYSRAELRGMAELCLEQNVCIVSDEIHSELLLGGSAHLPVATLSKDIERNTITLVAPSKTYNVPGLFCGFAIIPDAQLRGRFQAAASRMIHHVSSLSLIAAQAAYSGACDAWLNAMRTMLTANRDWIVATLRDRFPLLRTTVPQATYLAWIDCHRLNLQEQTPGDFFLENARVALTKGEDFGSGGRGFVRLNFGTTSQILQEVMARLSASLEAGTLTS
jgi:cysteine-S-conjugate beta-lyase